MTIQEATDQHTWDAFLQMQTFSPFLQSWTMGEVYRDTGQQPIRLELREGNELIGICQGIIVPARRGKHLAVPYGPVLAASCQLSAVSTLIDELKRIAQAHKCAFLRISPFFPAHGATPGWPPPGAKPSPLHLLAEHIWYLPLTSPHPWNHGTWNVERGTDMSHTFASPDQLLSNMRQNTRNLIHRAKREGVTVVRSDDPVRDIPQFLTLHEETRKRHHFTPYTDDFFRTQVAHFAPQGGCTLYLAQYRGETIASSIHMHMGSETSYHHGASTQKYPKIPASYLLQWTAIADALERGDHTYSFWGIAPEGVRKHPFAGVTLFKRGFGGQLFELVHCHDIPLSPAYALTRGIETVRKWRRGF